MYTLLNHLGMTPAKICFRSTAGKEYDAPKMPYRFYNESEKENENLNSINNSTLFLSKITDFLMVLQVTVP